MMLDYCRYYQFYFQIVLSQSLVNISQYSVCASSNIKGEEVHFNKVIKNACLLNRCYFKILRCMNKILKFDNLLLLLILTNHFYFMVFFQVDKETITNYCTYNIKLCLVFLLFSLILVVLVLTCGILVGFSISLIMQVCQLVDYSPYSYMFNHA